MNSQAGFTDSGIAQALSRLHRLQCFDISGCANIYSSTLNTAAQTCECLEILRVANCHQVGVQSVISILRACQRLGELTINGCSGLRELENSLVPAIITAPALHTLHCNMVPEFAPAFTRKIREARPDMIVRQFGRKYCNGEFEFEYPNAVPVKEKKVKKGAKKGGKKKKK